jgi:hypothetical protein
VWVLVLLEAVLSELGSFELDLALLEEVLDDRDDSDRGAASFALLGASKRLPLWFNIPWFNIPCPSVKVSASVPRLLGCVQLRGIFLSSRRKHSLGLAIYNILELIKV